MIPVGHEQHLGRKSLVIMILRDLIPCVVLLFLVMFLSIFKQSILSFLTDNAQSSDNAFPILSDGVLVLLPQIIPATFFLAIITGAIGLAISILSYQYFTFTLEEFGIKLKRGILNVEEITIPYRQMQNVDVTRPLLYRAFGLSRLVIFSAGHEQSGEPEQTDTIFDPIDAEIAEEIRELLGRRIGVQVIESESKADRDQQIARATPPTSL